MADRDELMGGYYATVPDPVLSDATLRWASMVLYAKITSYTKKTGFCYASNETLIREMTRVDPETGVEQPVTERTLQSWLAELKKRGHIWTDTGPYPPDKNGKVRIGRRIYIGRTLVPPVRGEENFTHENIFTHGVKKSSPHIKCSNNTANNKPSIFPEGQARFDSFWKVYPRKDAKSKAKEAWAKLERIGEVDADMMIAILAAVARQKLTDQWQRENGRYIPMAATWLNQRRWEDELPEAAKQSEAKGGFGWQ